MPIKQYYEEEEIAGLHVTAHMASFLSVEQESAADADGDEVTMNSW